MVANLIGANGNADAFFVAFKIPNFLRRLFAEGALHRPLCPYWLIPVRGWSGGCPGVD